MRERSQRKGVFVGVLAFVKELDHKVAAANVVHQIAEFLVAERVVAEVLDYGAAIRVSVRFAHLIVCEAGITRQQQRPQLVVPEQIDDLFVRQD